MVQDRKSPFTSANLITYAFLAFIAFMAFLGAAAAAFAAFLAILLSTGERSKPQGMRMSLKTSFLEHQEATKVQICLNVRETSKINEGNLLSGTSAPA